MSRAPRLVVPLLTIALSIATSCGDDSGPSRAGTTGAVRGTITVFAAASLTAAFDEIGKAFALKYPDAKATFSFDASSALVQQITQGAPADLLASADTANMDKLVKAGLNGEAPVVFATNVLQIIVGAGNPKRITSVTDLAKPDLKVVLCAPEVPCGKYAEQILDTAEVTVKPASLEQNVKGVVTKVTSGEADAGIVYLTDVKAAGRRAAGVDVPKDINVVAEYPIASVKGSKEADVDAAFVAFVVGPEGQAILAKYGFGSP